MSKILIVVLILSSLPVKSVEAYNDGEGTGTVSGSGTWADDKMGYRIYVVDNKGNRVSNRVDFRFSNRGLQGNYVGLDEMYGGNERFNNNYKGNDKVVSELVSYHVKGSMPPTPIAQKGSSSKYEAQGAEFTSWFFDGKTNISESTFGGSTWKAPNASKADLEKLDEGNEGTVGSGDAGSGSSGENNTINNSKITKPDESDWESVTYETNDTVVTVSSFVSDQSYRYSIYTQNKQFIDENNNVSSHVVQSYKEALDLRYKNSNIIDKPLKQELEDIYYSLIASNNKSEAIEMMYEIANYAESNYGNLLNRVGTSDGGIM